MLRGVVVFGRLLREAGLDVGTGRIALAAAALDLVSITDRDNVYWALRLTLVSRHEDLEAFDRAFAAWFDRTLIPAPLPRRADETERQLQGRTGQVADSGAGEVNEASPGWTAEELLRRKDFATLSNDEFAELRALIRAVSASRPLRRTRRRRVDPRGDVLDLRRMARLSLATAGEPIERSYRGRTFSPRKLVVLCDVSGSMEPYARALLLFVHALVSAGPRVEVFAFGTRLTRLTQDLRGRNVEQSLEAAAERIVDWSGGTRIGASLKQFNDEWGRRALSRGSIVVILSDGWEREDSALVANEMGRLSRAAYATIWVNPLKGHPEYQPLAGGMRAALPYVDRFVAGQNLDDLCVLAEVIRGIERRHAA